MQSTPPPPIIHPQRTPDPPKHTLDSNLNTNPTRTQPGALIPPLQTPNSSMSASTHSRRGSVSEKALVEPPPPARRWGQLP